MSKWTPEAVAFLVTALCTGVGGLLTSLAALVHSIRNRAQLVAERDAAMDRTRLVVKDEIASVTGNGHSIAPVPTDDAS